MQPLRFTLLHKTIRSQTPLPLFIHLTGKIKEWSGGGRKMERGREVCWKNRERDRKRERGL